MWWHAGVIMHLKVEGLHLTGYFVLRNGLYVQQISLPPWHLFWNSTDKFIVMGLAVWKSWLWKFQQQFLSGFEIKILFLDMDWACGQKS